MMKDIILMRVGFFETAADVSAAATSGERPSEELAARYLEQGEVVVAAMQWVDDLLDADSKNICQYSIRTDGVWVWPDSLAYYVRKYHVQLPVEFLSRMESNDWTVGALEDAVVDVICERLADELSEAGQ
ncbi:hypothetical protein ABZT17_42390 [Streptomyces sp. NPDC005648]|uniref:hypothetical protein n=1 Tax=Streptomyces sp. NPDC005648 TaxID=3157044 RepID=UPI0033AB195A